MQHVPPKSRFSAMRAIRQAGCTLASARRTRSLLTRDVRDMFRHLDEEESYAPYRSIGFKMRFPYL